MCERGGRTLTAQVDAKRAQRRTGEPVSEGDEGTGTAPRRSLGVWSVSRHE